MNLNPFIDLIALILNLYSWVVGAWIILGLLISFEIVNRYNQYVAKIYVALSKLTEPVLVKIRKYLPDLGGIDISPVILFIIIRFFISVLYSYFYIYQQ